ncbi:hypothetical protein L2E82_17530 [Cichorium intybus]|uniref:Uncharacterized protein n=1 Tax=Cichorium intybus TaxID=13427 RepID=A0ACB9F8Z9_CICIN|nr:hypothetical protein L2E82_17530 [Cichorium intybus]
MGTLSVEIRETSSCQPPPSSKGDALYNKKAAAAPVWLSFDSKEQNVCYGDAGGFHPVVVKPPPLSRRLQLVSYVTVESVIETSVDGEVIGSTDVEMVMNIVSRVNSATHSDHRSAPSPLSPTRTLPCDVWRMERGACA